MTAKDFRHLETAARVFAGENCLRQLGSELDRLGCKRAVLMCGNTLSQPGAALERVKAALGPRLAGVFGGVRAHSPVPDVIAAVEVLRELQADAVIAYGGGSAVITARAAAIGLAEGVDFHALCTQFAPGKAPHSPKLAASKLPQFVIATTPTTAYGKAGSAILDPASGHRLALFDPKTRATTVFFDPVLALTAPVSLYTSACVSSLALATEGLESAARDPLSDAMLLHALRLMHDYLPVINSNPSDGAARVQLMAAAWLAARGTDNTSAGINAALTHTLGARHGLELGVENGTLNAIFLPHTMRYNGQVTGARLAVVAQALGRHQTAADGDAPEAAIAAVEDLWKQLGIPRRLRDVGVTADMLRQIAEDARTDFFLHQNVRKVGSTDEVLQVLQAAW